MNPLDYVIVMLACATACMFGGLVYSALFPIAIMLGFTSLFGFVLIEMEEKGDHGYGRKKK